jgi:thymidine kinase
MSKLYFRYSTMASGKSLDLLKTAYNYEERDKKVMLFTSNLDNRFGKKVIASRVGLKREALSFDSNTNIFNQVSDLSSELDCVLIDESQFLTKDQVWQLTDIVDYLNIDVISYGIRSDFKGEPFEGSIYLMTLADEIEELKTVCKYGEYATMNMRTQNGNAIFDGDQVLIGGNDSYLPVCRKYYKDAKKNNKETNIPNYSSNFNDVQKKEEKVDLGYLKRLQKWFDLNVGWFFVNGRKQEAWFEYLKNKYK